MHRNECFHGDAHSNIVSPRSMEELMTSPRSRCAYSVLYRGYRSPTAFLQITHINQLSIAAHLITYSRDFQHLSLYTLLYNVFSRLVLANRPFLSSLVLYTITLLLFTLKYILSYMLPFFKLYTITSLFQLLRFITIP
jgi:hypothetical protein